MAATSRVSSGLGVSSGLAARYASALLDLADEARDLDTVAGDLSTVKEALAVSADLSVLIRSPLVSRSDQGRAMAAVLDGIEASELTRRFVGVLSANRRLGALAAIADAYLQELARRRGEAVADITAARELTDDQRAALDDQLKRVLGSKVAMRITVDPALLGGMIVKVGSTMVDSSLRTKLNKMQLAMKGVA